MLQQDYWSRELANIDGMEAQYRSFMEPAAEGEKPPKLAERMNALKGVERCIRLRMNLIKEAGRHPTAEPEPEPPCTVDLARLSDSALREVQQALIPAMSNLKEGEE